MTALSIVQSACRRLGLDVPRVLFSSTDPLLVQMIGIMNEELLSLARSYPWKTLTKEKTFTSVAQAEQTSSVPTDFDYFVDDTMYNRTLKRKVHGPINSVEWQALQASSLSSSLESYFRFRGENTNSLYNTNLSVNIYPTATAGQTIAYEYVSKNRILLSNGNSVPGTTTFAPHFMFGDELTSLSLSDATPDYQTSVLDEEQITKGVIWRWKQRKGFDYAEDFNSYEADLEQLKARDGGSRTLNLGKKKSNYFFPNVPESDFG
jgi:hypothetical protein